MHSNLDPVIVVMKDSVVKFAKVFVDAALVGLHIFFEVVYRHARAMPEKRTLGKEETGGRAAVPIWLEFMQGATEDQPVNDFPIPDGIVFVNIDAKTGLRATPGDDNLLLECFRRGSEPGQMIQRAQGPAPDDFFRGDF